MLLNLKKLQMIIILGFKPKTYNFETADSSLEQDIKLNTSNAIFTNNNKNKQNISGPIKYN